MSLCSTPFHTEWRSNSTGQRFVHSNREKFAQFLTIQAKKADRVNFVFWLNEDKQIVIFWWKRLIWKKKNDDRIYGLRMVLIIEMGLKAGVNFALRIYILYICRIYTLCWYFIINIRFPSIDYMLNELEMFQLTFWLQREQLTLDVYGYAPPHNNSI